jgi:hypothetical protein
VKHISSPHIASLCLFLISITCLTPLPIAVAESNEKELSNGILSYGTIVYSSAPTPNPSGSLHIDGNKLKDSDGNVVILRGVTFQSVAWGDSTNMLTENQFAYMHNWGCNAVNVEIWTYQLYRGEFGKGSNDFSDPNFWAKLDNIVSWATTHNLYVVLSGYTCAGMLPAPHDAHPTNDLKYVFSEVDTWSNFIGYWQDYASRYKNYNNIIYMLMMEPLDCDFATYTFYMQQTIDAIRAIDSDAICAIQPVNSEADYAGGMWNNIGFWFQQSNPISRPNIMFSFDPYGFHTYPNNNLAAIQSIYSSCGAYWLLNSGFPVFLGETGGDLRTHTSSYNNWDTTWLNSMFAYADSIDSGYCCYNWRVVDVGPLIADWNGNPTTYGNVVKSYFLSH